MLPTCKNHCIYANPSNCVDSAAQQTHPPKLRLRCTIIPDLLWVTEERAVASKSDAKWIIETTVTLRCSWYSSKCTTITRNWNNTHVHMYTPPKPYQRVSSGQPHSAGGLIRRKNKICINKCTWTSDIRIGCMCQLEWDAQVVVRFRNMILLLNTTNSWLQLQRILPVWKNYSKFKYGHLFFNSFVSIISNITFISYI